MSDIGNMKKNMSIFNPTDMAAMATPGHPGQVDPTKTTVREFFEGFGVDVDGPVMQLIDFTNKQVDNANPVKKMQNIAGTGTPPSSGPPTAGPEMANRMPQGAPTNASLEGLVGQLGG
jgi:hypothetical protein